LLAVVGGSDVEEGGVVAGEDGGWWESEQRTTEQKRLRKIELDLSVLLRRNKAWQLAECTHTQHRK